MNENFKNHLVAFKVKGDFLELLKKEAVKRGLSSSLCAKEILFETLSGFDEKQEVFLRRFDKLDESIELLCEIASLGAAASTLPLDAAQQNVAVVNQQLKAHFKLSSGLAKNLVELIGKGKL